MKSVSGSFGIVVYSVRKHIRAKENFDVWRLHHQTWHCSCTCFQAKDLVLVSVSLCCRFQNSKLKLAELNQKFTSHTHQLSTTQGETNLSVPWCRGEWTQPSAFCTPCWELLANLQSGIAGSNRLSKGRSNPTLEAHNRDFQAQPFKHRSPT